MEGSKAAGESAPSGAEVAVVEEGGSASAIGRGASAGADAGGGRRKSSNEYSQLATNEGEAGSCEGERM